MLLANRLILPEFDTVISARPAAVSAFPVTAPPDDLLYTDYRAPMNMAWIITLEPTCRNGRRKARRQDYLFATRESLAHWINSALQRTAESPKSRPQQTAKYLSSFAGDPRKMKGLDRVLLRPLLTRRRHIRKKETHDAVFIIALFVVQHSGVISVLQDHQFVRRRGDPEQFGGRCGQHGIVRRFEIKLGDSRKFCDARIQRRHISELPIEPAKNQLRHSGDRGSGSQPGSADLQRDHFVRVS